MSAATQTPPARVKKPGLFINRNFGLLWMGQAISNVGDTLFDTSLVLWIATTIARGQSWAPLAVSGVLLAVSVPVFVVGPIAGVFVDRWDKRRTLLWSDLLRGLLVLLLALTSGMVPLPFVDGGRLSVFWQLGTVYGVVALCSVCSQFFIPARLALVGDIVAPPHRARAFGQMQATFFLSIVLGPALAALLFFSIGVQWALALNAISFFVSFLAVLALRAPRPARSVPPGQNGHLVRELVAGLRLLLGNPALRAIALSLVVAFGGLGVLQSLGVFFVTQNLRAPASDYGFLASVLGAGSIAGAILAGLVIQRLGLARIYWLSLIAFGVLIISAARMTSVTPGLVVAFLLGLPNAALNIAVAPLQLELTPREYLGRITSLLTPAGNLALIVAVALGGYLDSTVLAGFHATWLGLSFGPVDTIFTGAGILAIVGGLYARASLRQVPLAQGAAATAPHEPSAPPGGAT
jgi:MFS family permease